MQATVALNQKDIEAAIVAVVNARGFKAKGTVSFSIDTGDRPGDARTISASVAVEPTEPRRAVCGCGAPSCDICHG